VLTVLGTITLFTGTMQALRQEQSKRLLAFHSIGQMGYIMLGTGACMLLLGRGNVHCSAIGAVGLTGALFHVLNHGVFKALLFLNAGSLLWAVETQDLNKLGGLLKLMPVTAVTAGVASLSIAGVPMFNGFASKWHIYVASFLASREIHYLALCGLLALFTSGLTLASFMKFFGSSFLGRRSAWVNERLAEKGRLEVVGLMRVPQVFLSLVCILLGMVPALGTDLVARALSTSHQGWGEEMAAGLATVSRSLWGTGVSDGAACFSPVAIGLALGTGFAFAALLTGAGGAGRRAATPWLCGYAIENEHNRYRAHGYYWDVKKLFRWLGGGGRVERLESDGTASGSRHRGERV
ncbi:MAG: proton-conducting transporter membrane subunit, partial [Verrucomicrobiae bacterium]|nr:proton-conducting transporter membrane subunit [Verrucomicrobiae bacterium]